MMTAISVPTLVDVRTAGPMPVVRVLRAYVNEIKFELLRMLRSPTFSIPFLLLPVPVYLFFGVMLAGPAVAKNPGLANYLFSGFAVFAVMGPAFFGAGCTLALERDAGFLKLKRALPAPGGAYLIAKMATGMVFAALAMAPLVAAGLIAGKITLTGVQLTLLSFVMVVGTLPFSAIGLFIGAHASGSATPAITNIIFLPMLWLSGLFIPLPKFLESWVLIWPAFHLNQVALGAAGVTEFRFISPAISAGVLAGVTVLFAGLAIRRLARRG
jgi:ABC-2 type transport system permease protein